MRFWRRYLAWRQRSVTRLELAPNGFSIVGHQERRAIEWDAITRIVACKRDLYATDLLCLLIQTAETWIEIHEDMPGFRETESVLETRLGRIDI